MADFASTEREGRHLYKLMIGTITPRPIAWVSTRSASGVGNLAPYSFFNGVTWNPPTLAFSSIDRPNGMKDTARNIAEHPECIVHIVSAELAEKMNQTCGDYGADIDEMVEAGLTAVPGAAVDVPRVGEALVALECRVTQVLRLGAQPPLCSHIIAEVLHWHMDDRILDEAARTPVDAAALDSVGRMGGVEYSYTRDRFALERPVIAPEDPKSIPAAEARAGGRKAGD